MTVRELLREGTTRLKSPSGNALVDSPGLDAALLLAEVLQTDRAGLIIAGPDLIDDSIRRRYAELLDRRLSGECAAYILGRREFRGLEFTVSPQVLVPRPDTETLVEAVVDWVEKQNRPDGPPLKVLDLCTGSGAVAIALKHECPELLVTASDISAGALEIAAANAARLLGTADAVTFMQSDLFENIENGTGADTGVTFDVITANPPYIPSPVIDGLAPEVRQEPRLALDGGEDGLDLIRRIIRETPGHLQNGGAIFIEADDRQMDIIRQLLEQEGFRDIEVRKDLAGLRRVISGSI
ncbi:release factor glutamine methyltransferase [Spirochaetia bacterium]|nr:release factor glutamine methyltransferase [Spirochaetia bacterium]